MTTKIQYLQSHLETAGFNAKIWQDRRIYINGYGRDIKAYFDFPDGDQHDEAAPDPLNGSRLRVFSNCNQDGQWLVNRGKQVKYSIATKLVEAGLLAEVVKDWRLILL